MFKWRRLVFPDCNILFVLLRMLFVTLFLPYMFVYMIGIMLTQGFSRVRVTRSLALCVCFVDRHFVFCLLTIVLSVIL
jgi:hypothetical protein